MADPSRRLHVAVGLLGVAAIGSALIVGTALTEPDKIREPFTITRYVRQYLFGSYAHHHLVVNGSKAAAYLGLLLAPLALLWLMYRQDRGQRERKFWVGVLEPMTDLRGAILVQAIEGTCSRPVFHPYRGEVRLNRTEIRRWMRCLRESGELKPRRRTPRAPAPWQKRHPEAGNEDGTIWLPASNSDPTS